MNCHFCGQSLSLAQHFAYLVESHTVDNPTMLAAIRRMPQDRGRPIPACRSCDTTTVRQHTAASVARVRAPAFAQGGIFMLGAVMVLGLALIGRDDA